VHCWERGEVARRLDRIEKGEKGGWTRTRSTSNRGGGGAISIGMKKGGRGAFSVYCAPKGKRGEREEGGFLILIEKKGRLAQLLERQEGKGKKGEPCLPPAEKGNKRGGRIFV